MAKKRSEPVNGNQEFANPPLVVVVSTPIAQQTNTMTEKKDVIETLIEKSKPVIGNLTFGCVMGYCSGVALQKVGKALAVVVGMGFVGLQGAAHLGYIQIDWEKIRISVVNSMDQNKDGKINTEDVKVYWKQFKKVMVHRVPSAGGFSLGFLYGVRSG